MKKFFTSSVAFVLYGVVVIVSGLFLFGSAHASVPNPGHPWYQIGDGTFAVATNTGGPFWFTFPSANATVLTSAAAVTTAQGGTGLTSSGPNGSVLESNGSAWVATSSFINSLVIRPPTATGATITTFPNKSQSSSTAVLFTVPAPITVNLITFDVNAVTTAGTYKLCVYTETGNKMIDVTTTAVTAGVNSTTVSGVQLLPGNYYFTMGCAAACSNTVVSWTTTATAWVNGATVANHKEVWEGVLTRVSSGNCDATMGTLTGNATASASPVVRLDN